MIIHVLLLYRKVLQHWNKSLMLTKAAFIWLIIPLNSNIVKYYYNLK